MNHDYQDLTKIRDHWTENNFLLTVETYFQHSILRLSLAINLNLTLDNPER